MEAESSADRMSPSEHPDVRFVVEELDRASCSAHAKTMAIEAIAIADEGGTADDWRRGVAERHADHRQWEQHLSEAERCMRASGLWPWAHAEGAGSGGA